MDFSGCLAWWVGAALAVVQPAVPATAPGGGAAAVLHRWDAARAAAWAGGDVAELRSLYTPGSAAGRADVRLLRRYAARGLAVDGLRTQVFHIGVLDRGRGRLVLQVVDRIAGGVAVGRAGCRPLPRDRADRRTITFRRTDGRWLVSDVR